MSLNKSQWKDVLATFGAVAVAWVLFEIVAQMGGIGGFFTKNDDPWWFVSLAICIAIGRYLIHKSFNKGVEEGKLQHK